MFDSVKNMNSDLTRHLNLTSFQFFSLQVDSYDRDSGIHKIHWELIANNSNMVFRNGDIPGNRTNVKFFFICIKRVMFIFRINHG